MIGHILNYFLSFHKRTPLIVGKGFVDQSPTWITRLTKSKVLDSLSCVGKGGVLCKSVLTPECLCWGVYAYINYKRRLSILISSSENFLLAGSSNFYSYFDSNNLIPTLATSSNICKILIEVHTLFSSYWFLRFSTNFQFY